MALTSIEIKRLLQPMKDFAPAILRCAEIVEAAEQGEVTLRQQVDALAEGESANQRLQDRLRLKELELANAHEEVVQARAETANVVPVVTVGAWAIGVVTVREFVGPASVVPVREVTTEYPHVKVVKV